MMAKRVDRELTVLAVGYRRVVIEQALLGTPTLLPDP